MNKAVKAVFKALLSSDGFFSRNGNSQVKVVAATDVPTDRILTAWGLEVLRVSEFNGEVTVRYSGYSGKHQSMETLSLVGEVFDSLCKQMLSGYQAKVVKATDGIPRSVSLTNQGQEVLSFWATVPSAQFQQVLAA